MCVVGHAGALAAEEDRVVRRERKTMQRDGAARGHQDQPRLRCSAGEESRPRGVTAENEISRIIKDGALEPSVIEQETAWLDQIDRHSEASREPQQGPGVLRNVGLEQGETQKRPPAAGTLGSLVVVCRDYTRFAADLCGSLSHSSLSSTV